MRATACWTILSSSTATPNGRCRPSLFRINTRLEGCPRYAPRCTRSCRSPSRSSTPCAYIFQVILSTPAAASFNVIEAFAQQVDGQMMQQCSEPLLLPFLRCLTHALQPLGHAWAALCRSHVRLSNALLGPRPSLQALRGWLPFLVQTLHRYYARVRL